MNEQITTAAKIVKKERQKKNGDVYVSNFLIAWIFFLMVVTQQIDKFTRGTWWQTLDWSVNFIFFYSQAKLNWFGNDLNLDRSYEFILFDRSKAVHTMTTVSKLRLCFSRKQRTGSTTFRTIFNQNIHTTMSYYSFRSYETDAIELSNQAI